MGMKEMVRRKQAKRIYKQLKKIKDSVDGIHSISDLQKIGEDMKSRALGIFKVDSKLISKYQDAYNRISKATFIGSNIDDIRKTVKNLIDFNMQSIGGMVR